MGHRHAGNFLKPGDTALPPANCPYLPIVPGVVPISSRGGDCHQVIVSCEQTFQALLLLLVLTQRPWSNSGFRRQPERQV